jgi:alkaline phosphatase
MAALVGARDATTPITHATPAGFYAHVPNRYADVAQIAEQLLEHGPDVALGGGLADFLPETVELDRAVEAVLDYQRQHPDVLVLLTADHATGGLAINDFVDLEALRRYRASVDWMTAQIRNAGTGAELVAEMTGFTDITDAELDPSAPTSTATRPPAVSAACSPTATA